MPNIDIHIYMHTILVTHEVVCMLQLIISNLVFTAGSDYGNGDYSVIFVKGSSTACTNIPILDNSILERKECFKVAFTIPSDPLVVLENPEGPLTGTVNILDDDGMYK